MKLQVLIVCVDTDVSMWRTYDNIPNHAPDLLGDAEELFHTKPFTKYCVRTIHNLLETNLDKEIYFKVISWIPGDDKPLILDNSSGDEFIVFNTMGVYIEVTYTKKGSSTILDTVSNHTMYYCD